MAKMTFNKTRKEKLREAYMKARGEDKKTFFFGGTELFVPYAKYLLEHLDNVIK